MADPRVEISPLDWKVPIVNPETGAPSLQFLRLWQQLFGNETGTFTKALLGVKKADAAQATASAAVPQTRLINTTAPITGGGNLSADRTLAHANTAVTPGAYTNANITVDQKGHITAAANGSSSGSGATIDIGAAETAPANSVGAAASKGNVIKPLKNINVSSIYARMFSKVIGATYVATIATLSTPTGFTIGTVLGTSNTYTAADVNQEYIELTFASAVALTAGTRYVLIVSRTGVVGTTILTISNPTASGNIYYPSLATDTGQSDCGFTSYTAANPPVAGTVTSNSGTPGAYSIGLKYT